MLKRSRRIPQALFPTLGRGRVFAGKFASFKVSRAQNPQDDSRFAFVVSSKIAKTAVLRNKLRRRGYAVVRPLYSRIHKGYLAAFFLKLEATKATSSELSDDIRSLLSKSGLI